MIDLVSLVIPSAMAAETAGAPADPGAATPILLLLVIVAMMYFLFIRPKAKQDKEHKALVAGVAVGDEIVTIGGIVGKIKKIDGTFLVLAVSDGVSIRVQKSSVASALPKGTVKYQD